MRIIAGEYRGRRIKHPQNKEIRPTKDRVREAVFSMIAEKVPGSRVLDLFAGSGAYGLEALSRGAKSCIFVEENRDACRVIQDNIDSLSLSERTQIAQEDVFYAAESLSENGEKFDLVFSDPPYKTGLAKKTLNSIYHYDILNPAGLLILEHYRTEETPKTEGSVSIVKQKTYGDISISIYLKD